MSMRSTLTRALAAGALVSTGAVVTAPAASADSVWDRVAACESGGNWSINTGNGFYGGLQFHQPTWVGHGGQEFAAYAHQATRAQQIAVAQRVLATQGPGAWPVCSVKAGLTRANGGAGTAPAPAAQPAPAPAPVVEAPREQALAPAPVVEAPAAQPAPAPAPVVQAPAPQREDLVRYTIVAGDTTSTIADRHGSTVAELVAINGLPAGGALIFAGDTMLVPGAAKADVSRTVTIAPGDTLAELARTHGTTVDALVEANGIADPDLIVAGGSLTVR